MLAPLRTLILCALVAGSSELAATKALPPLTMEHITGAWVGPNLGPSSSNSYWRFRIEESGKGRAAVLWDDSEISAYRIVDIRIDGPDITIQTEPIGEALPLNISGKTQMGGMDLQIQSRGKCCLIDVHLEPESLLKGRIRKLQKVTDVAN